MEIIQVIHFFFFKEHLNANSTNNIFLFKWNNKSSGSLSRLFSRSIVMAETCVNETINIFPLDYALFML